MIIQTKSRRLLSTLLAVMVVFGLFAAFPLTAYASDANELRNQINSFDPHGSGTLSATSSGNSVYVTGTVTGATIPLNLDIGTYVTIYWSASYSGTVSDLQGLVRLSGIGSFRVNEDGSIINTGAGSAVAVVSGVPRVIISGGKVSATAGFAIYISTPSIDISVGSGEVSATSGASIGVNGANSKVTVSGGSVSATTGAAIAVNQAGVRVNITGGNVSTTNGFAVAVNGANVIVQMSGGLLTSFREAAAIAVAGTGSTVYVTSGVIGAYGTAVTGEGNVINMTNGGTPTIGETAVVCAWNKPSGTPTYTVGSSTDLAVLPASATVFWDKIGSQNGVSYANSTNIGFLPIIGVTVNTASGVAPTITGPANMTLAVGYADTSTDAYTITGTPAPTVTKTSGNANITWNNTTKKLNIRDGLAAGTYPVVLTATNSSGSTTLNFTLTVTTSVAPTITGPTSMTLTAGYAATSTGVYTVSGTPAPTVSKTSGNANITWNNGTKKLDIAAGTYSVVLTATSSGGSATLTFTLTVTASGGIPFPFTDVFPADWFYNDVKTAWEMGLINGKTETTFVPGENLTYAEAVKLAACMHQLYTMGSVTLTNGSPAWWDSYVTYAKDNNIINKDYEWSTPATRAGYMEIFAKALPDSALAPVNTVADGAIPDVPTTHPQAAAIYKLYRAGILQGVDDAHNCNPNSNILRREVAAILNRMMNPSARISFSM